jgi:hypothetical protein
MKLKLLNQIFDEQDEEKMGWLVLGSFVVGFILLFIFLGILFFPKVLFGIFLTILILVGMVVAGYFVIEWAYSYYKKIKASQEEEKRKADAKINSN